MYIESPLTTRQSKKTQEAAVAQQPRSGKRFTCVLQKFFRDSDGESWNDDVIQRANAARSYIPSVNHAIE